jgi:transcriptional regulator with XRE-family HTH domain
VNPEQRPEPSRLRPRTPRRPELRVFAERLPRFRKAWDSRHPYEPPMTQERLAERMEVDTRTVREWERGTCAPRTFERAMQLGEVLDVSLEELGLSSSAMTAGRRSHWMAMDALSPMTTRVIDDLVWATRTVLTPKPPERLPPMLDGAAPLESDDRERCWVDGMLGIPEQVGPHMFDDLQALTRSHTELSHVMAPRSLLPTVRCHLATRIWLPSSGD